VQGSANVAIGYNAGSNISAASSVSIGNGAIGRELGAVAIGQSALATKARSVAIGSSSVATQADTVSVGSASKQRRIVNVANAVAQTDAVNLRQVQALIAAATIAPAAARPVSLLALPTHSGVADRAGSGSDRPGSGMRPASSRDSEANGGSAHNAGDAARGDDDDLEPSIVVGWANVRADGTLSRARNVVGNARRGIGDYEIVLKKRSLESCNVNATLHSAGFVSVNPGSLPNSLLVEIRNRYGVLTDAGFHLRVVC
jgi:autotransporter adhesin